VFVNEPSFSRCELAGRKKTSVPIVSGDTSPDSTSGLSYQNDALSISTRSRTTSQSSRPSASRCALPLAEPIAGFSPATM
jgi:hypothetical protein